MKKIKPQQIAEIAVAALEELKGINIQVLDVTALTTITDIMIIASGRSGRQVKALADKVQEKVKQAGIPLLGVEGDREAEWILVDAGDVIVHIMQPATRTYYQLEKLWSVEEAAKDNSSI